MLESIFIMLLIAGIILLILSFVWESLTLSIIDLIIWMILSISIYSIEIPYQYESGGSIVEATHSLESMYPLTWLFMGVAIIMFLHVISMVFSMYQGHEKKIM